MYFLVNCDENRHTRIHNCFKSENWLWLKESIPIPILRFLIQHQVPFPFRWLMQKSNVSETLQVLEHPFEKFLHILVNIRSANPNLVSWLSMIKIKMLLLRMVKIITIVLLNHLSSFSSTRCWTIAVSCRGTSREKSLFKNS